MIKLVKVLLLTLPAIIIISCVSSDPLSKATGFLFNQETLKQIGTYQWLLIFVVVSYTFQPFIYGIISKKGDRKWQKDMLDTQNRIVNIINQVENSQIALSEKIFGNHISINQAFIILDNIFYKHINEKKIWLRCHYSNFNSNSNIDIKIQTKIADDKMKAITKNEVSNLNNFTVEIAPNKYMILGDSFWNLIVWNKFTPSVVKIMLDFNLTIDERISQVSDLMESYLSGIKIDIFK